MPTYYYLYVTSLLSQSGSLLEDLYKVVLSTSVQLFSGYWVCLWRSCIFGQLAWSLVLAVEAGVNISVSSVRICLEIVKSNVSLNFESKHSFWSFWLASNHKQGDSQNMFWTMWTYSILIRLVCCLFFYYFKQVEITHFSLAVENLNS